MARKTVDELEKEKLAALNQDTEDARAVKEATMKGNVNTFNQQVDTSVAQQKGIYEDSIRDAERAEKSQLDDNYIDELVARKNIENTMADMGMTDSGLNRGQQTAISVMRGNADAGARRKKVDRVQSLRDAIDQVMLGGEQQKTAYQQQQSAALSEWYQNQLLTNKQNARTAAVEQYNAETEAIEKQQEAIRKQNELMLKNGYVQQGDSWVKDNTAERTTYAMTLIKNGIPEDEAWTDAQYRYGAMSAKDTLRYQAKKAGYSDAAAVAYAEAGGGEAGEAAAGERIAADAHALVENISFEVSGKIWDFRKGTFWRSAGEGDGRLVGEKVKELLEKNETYKGMSTLEKKAAASFAIAKSVEESFPNENQEANLKRIRRACEEYTVADYNFAVSYFLDNQGNGTSQPKQQATQNKSDAERVSDYYKNASSMPGRLL